MKFYCYTQNNNLFSNNTREIRQVIEKVASFTDTNDLVVVLYLRRRSSWTGGTAYTREWMYPKDFCAKRGKWSFTQRLGIPTDIPSRFKLIRVLLKGDHNQYPLIEIDRYHWQHQYHSFRDHLAFLFAHELHHFRRYHLGLHPHEGEHSANAWALNHINDLGYQVKSIRVARPKGRRKKKHKNVVELINPFANTFHKNLPALADSNLWQKMILKTLTKLNTNSYEKLFNSQKPHFEKLRVLPCGTALRVVYDPTGKYQGKIVHVIRPMKRNSVRIVVETSDGKRWRWPMAWLALEY